MNILLTGANGLIGSYLLPLIEKKHTVYTVSSALSSKNNLVIDFSKDWDTNNLPNNLDLIIHLAQSEDFRDFPDKAREVYYVNTLSTMKLIDFANKNGVKKFIYASSGGIYGNGNEPFSESAEILHSKSLGFYLGTKYCSEILLDNFSSFLTIIYLRFFFVYGKGQKTGMLFPRLIDNIKNKNPIILQGESGIKINPIYAADAAKAIEKAFNIESSGKYNIGGDEVLTIREISEIIAQELNVNPEFIIQNVEPKHIFSDVSKMKNELIQPSYCLKDGIKEILK